MPENSGFWNETFNSFWLDLLKKQYMHNEQSIQIQLEIPELPPPRVSSIDDDISYEPIIINLDSDDVNINNHVGIVITMN